MEESGFGASVAAPAVRRVLEPIATNSVPAVRTIDDLAELGGAIEDDEAAADAETGGAA